MPKHENTKTFQKNDFPYKKGEFQTLTECDYCRQFKPGNRTFNCFGLAKEMGDDIPIRAQCPDNASICEKCAPEVIEQGGVTSVQDSVIKYLELPLCYGCSIDPNAWFCFGCGSVMHKELFHWVDTPILCPICVENLEEDEEFQPEWKLNVPSKLIP